MARPPRDLGVVWQSEDARGIELTRHDVPISGLPDALLGVRIAQISDLHRGRGNADPLIEAAVACANSLEPDYTFVTGDIVDGPRKDIEPAVQLVAGLRARLGVYAILGNHDHRGDPRLLIALLEAAGITVLYNRSVALGPGFRLIGLDDLHEGKPDLQAALKDAPADEPGILLSHNPGALRLVDPSRPLLILSGHTHGGQWHLPLIPPVAICLWHLHTRYVEGWYRRGSLRMYVNRGIGVTGPSVLARRIRCAPEISEFRLVGACRDTAEPAAGQRTASGSAT